MIFVGKYRTVVQRYLWYCGTTVVPWPRRYWYREKQVPRFHGSTVVPPNTTSQRLPWRWLPVQNGWSLEVTAFNCDNQRQYFTLFSDKFGFNLCLQPKNSCYNKTVSCAHNYVRV